jgi:hypothetical protein
MSKQNLTPIFEKDEWEAWREHPITNWFMETFLANAANEAKQTFVDHAWGRRDVDPVYHASLFERAKVLNEIRELDYESI